MRKYLYLVVDDPQNSDKEGGVDIRHNRSVRSSKNEQTVQDMRNMETGETWQKTQVSLGHADFEGEDDYAERIGDVIDEKLAEIDERHLRDAGLDPDDVLDTEGADA